MTGLLTFAAIITTIALLVSASNTGAKATTSHPFSRGSWGIAKWTSNRSRPLNPHERRWQTAILSGKDNDSRWRDLVAEIQTLERMNDTPGSTMPPTSFDSNWVETSLTDLEASLRDRSIATTQSSNPPGASTS